MTTKLFEMDESDLHSEDDESLARGLTALMTACETAARLGKRVEVRFTHPEHHHPKAPVVTTSGVGTLAVYAHEYGERFTQSEG